MSCKVYSVLLMFILSFYAIAGQTFLGFPYDENGDSFPSGNYSTVEGYVGGVTPSPSSKCAPPQKPGTQALVFTFHRIWGYLTFPEGCHRGDTTTHDLIVAVEPGGVHLDFFRLSLSCNTTSGQETLYNEEVEDQDLCETWVLNKTINLDIPVHANGKVHCIMEAETCTTYQGRVEFDTTSIREFTYEELQTAYNNLLGQYNMTLKELEYWKTEYQDLNSSYRDLSDLYNVTFNELQHWKTEYQNLNNTFSNLSGLYNSTVAELQHLKTEYQILNSTYNSLLSEHNATLNQLNQWISQFNALNSTYNTLLMNYSALNLDYQRLQSDYEALKISYDSLNASYLSLNFSYSALQEDYNTLLLEYNLLNSTCQQLNVNYTILVQTNQELIVNLTLLQARYDNLSTSYNLLNSTYYTLLQEAEDLRTLGRRLWLTIALLIILVAVAVAAAVCAVYIIKKEQE